MKAFRQVVTAPGCVVLQRRTLRTSIDEILEHDVVAMPEVVSVGVAGLERGHTIFHSQDLRMARHRVKDDEGHFVVVRGVIAALSVVALLDFLKNCYDWSDSQGELVRWAARFDSRDRALQALGIMLEQIGLLGRNERTQAMLPGLPRGVWVFQDPRRLEFPVIFRGETIWRCQCANGDSIAIEAHREVEHDGVRIPIPVYAVFKPNRETVTFWDGQRFGIGTSRRDIPVELDALLEHRGIPVAAKAVHQRPLVDLTATFLLRVPSRREARAFQGLRQADARRLDGPALLQPIAASIPILNGTERLRPMPVISDPEEALQVLRRAPAGRTYVPHRRPVPVEDLQLPIKPAWMVGCLPGLVVRS